LNLSFTDSKSFKSFSFSFTLDDFAQALGDLRGLDINNYADLTDLANAQYGANWSVEEYASAYQDNVDIINSLQSKMNELSMVLQQKDKYIQLLQTKLSSVPKI